MCVWQNSRLYKSLDTLTFKSQWKSDIVRMNFNNCLDQVSQQPMMQSSCQRDNLNLILIRAISACMTAGDRGMGGLSSDLRQRRSLPGIWRGTCRMRLRVCTGWPHPLLPRDPLLGSGAVVEESILYAMEINLITSHDQLQAISQNMLI